MCVCGAQYLYVQSGYVCVGTIVLLNGGEWATWNGKIKRKNEESRAKKRQKEA